MLRRASRPERRDYDQAPAAAGAWECEDTRLFGRALARRLCCGGVDGEQVAETGDVCGAAAIGEETVVANTVQALGKHVDEEAPDMRQRHL